MTTIYPIKIIPNITKLFKKKPRLTATDSSQETAANVPAAYYQQYTVMPKKKSIANFDPHYLSQTYGQQTVNFASIFMHKYDELRKAKYSESSTFTVPKEQIKEAVTTDPNQGICLYRGTWNFRIFNNNSIKGKIKNRVSLNVKASPDLIQELDKLMNKGEYIDSKGSKCKVPQSKRVSGYYKTYSSEKIDLWTTRHDPITMYFLDDLTPQMLQGICEITQKFARPSANGVELIDALPSKPWIAYSQEPQEKDVLDIVKSVETKYPELAQAIMLKSYVHWNRTEGYSDFQLSKGEFEAVKAVAEEYDAFKRLNQQ